MLEIGRGIFSQQKVEMTNQQKEFIQQRKTFNQKQDQMESKIKEIVDEQKNMIKQVLSQQQKATLNNLEKMEGKLEGLSLVNIQHSWGVSGTN